METLTRFLRHLQVVLLVCGVVHTFLNLFPSSHDTLHLLVPLLVPLLKLILALAGLLCRTTEFSTGDDKRDRRRAQVGKAREPGTREKRHNVALVVIARDLSGSIWHIATNLVPNPVPNAGILEVFRGSPSSHNSVTYEFSDSRSSFRVRRVSRKNRRN